MGRLRRERNLRVLQALASWRGLRGVYLEAVWDDALRNSPGPREARALGYPARPGADEAGQVLLLRAFRPGLRVAVVYEDEALRARVTPYEGLPLEKTVAGVLASARAVAVPLAEGPDLVLYVYGGGDPRKAALDLLRLMARHPVALADLARVNRGTPASWPTWRGWASTPASPPRPPGVPRRTTWGVPWPRGGFSSEDREGRLSRLAEAYFQYWWGEVGRPWVRARFPEPLPEEAQAVAEGFPRVELDGFWLDLRGLAFPWRRSFEAWPELALVPRRAGPALGR